MNSGCASSPQRAPAAYKKIASQRTSPHTRDAAPTMGVEPRTTRARKAPATSLSLSQYCAALVSSTRASTALMGGNWSVTPTDSHITYTFSFSAGNSCNNSLSAEAPRTHADQVGERKTRARARSLELSKSAQKRATSCGCAMELSGACPAGVRRGRSARTAASATSRPHPARSESRLFISCAEAANGEVRAESPGLLLALAARRLLLSLTHRVPGAACWTPFLLPAASVDATNARRRRPRFRWAR